MLAVIVPTVHPSRGEVYKRFMESWSDLFLKHDVYLITIYDGEEPQILTSDGHEDSAETLLGTDSDLIYNRTTAVKNLGLAYFMKRTEIENVLILDDDVRPIGDPIADHLKIIGQKTPLSWMTTMYPYPRGMPYKVRDEATVTVSHGVWEGVPDLDAPTQLVNGVTDYSFPQFIVPKSTLIPFCGMNVMLSRQAVPYLYFAPPWSAEGEVMNRNDDIWGGIMLKRSLDDTNQAMATGYSKILHERASNVYDSLIREALFIKLNETFFEGDVSHPYFQEYLNKAERWQKLWQP